MGEVYRARDPRLGRDVALKVLPDEASADPERLSRFRHEARAVASLDHPHILAVHDIGTDHGVDYVVFELLEGQTLRRRLEAGPLPPSKVVEYGAQVCRGLAAAHEHGVVHRDLKPENLFLTAEGQVKILDFGLARQTGPTADADELPRAETRSAITVAGRVMGTAGYMSPEQAQGQRADARSDIFALGAVLYEMLSGRRAFAGKTPVDALAAVLCGDPPDIEAKGVPPGLERLVRRCLEKDPGERFQSAHDLGLALETLSGPAPPARGPMRLRRTGLRSVAAGLATLGIVTVAVGMWRLWGLAPRFGHPTRSVRLAVLPFANLSGDSEQEYLSDGVTQEMIAQLGRLHPRGLSVIARTSVMRYKKTDTPIDRIGRELGVEYVLEGSARREGGRVRISAELIQVRDQTQLWADVYERELSGILALQADVARKVAGALALKLLPAEEARLAGARPVDPEAYEAYLKGSQHWIKMTKDDLDAAEAYFDLALRKDPAYAAAYAGRAWVWGCRYQIGLAPPSEAVPRTRESALKALSLDETLAEAHYVLATMKTWSEWDFGAAGPEWKRAVELDPNYAEGLAMYSHFLAIIGRSDEAMAAIDRALSVDPFNVTIHAFRAVGLRFARRFDEAATEARKALAMEPRNPVALPNLYLALAAKGMHREALVGIRDYLTVFYGVPDLGPLLDRAFVEGGFRAAAKQAAEAVATRATKVEALPTEVAELYVFAGEKVQALDWLERAYQARDPSLTYLRDPVYEPLRSEPRFQSLMRLMRLTTQ
jgi:TolB-like protein/Tfp pilus assembly protein PilF